VIAVAVGLAAFAAGFWYLRQSYSGLRRLGAETALAWRALDALYAARDAELAACVAGVEAAAGAALPSGSVCAGVMQAIDAAAAARAAGDIAAVSAAEHRLWNARARLDAALQDAALRSAARAPEEPSWTLLRMRLGPLETAIAAARERYNESVNLRNIRLTGFPGRLIAVGGGREAALLLDSALDEPRAPARLLDSV
jgi:hypothetical protein